MRESPAPSSSPQSRSEGIEDSAITILVVDDEPSVRKVTQRLLEARGYVVVTAENGRTAIDTYQADPGRFDLVLVDRNMPDVGGIEALAAMRRIKSDVRALLMSGATETRDTRGPQPTGFLLKPYGIDDLQAAVNAALAA